MSVVGQEMKKVSEERKSSAIQKKNRVAKHDVREEQRRSEGRLRGVKLGKAAVDINSDWIWYGATAAGAAGAAAG